MDHFLILNKFFLEYNWEHLSRFWQGFDVCLAKFFGANLSVTKFHIHQMESRNPLSLLRLIFVEKKA